MPVLRPPTAASLAFALACLGWAGDVLAQPAAPPAAVPSAAAKAPARAARCVAPALAKPASVADVLAKAGGTIALPVYADLVGGATTPPIQSQTDPAVPVTATLRTSAANFDAQPAPSNASVPVLYSSLVFNEGVTFADGSLAFDAASPCVFKPGYAYFVTVRAADMVIVDAASVAYDPATGGVSYASAVPGGLPIPGNVVVDIVVSRK